MLLPTAGGTETVGEPNEFTRRTRDFLLVVLLLTPLQAAGEEYAFRGYLSRRSARSCCRQPGRSRCGPCAALRAGPRLGQEPPIFFDRLAFGLVAGMLVILTGGLEAASPCTSSTTSWPSGWRSRSPT